MALRRLLKEEKKPVADVDQIALGIMMKEKLHMPNERMSARVREKRQRQLKLLNREKSKNKKRRKGDHPYWMRS